MTRSRYFLLILILGALSTVSPFSIDMYLPGFPAIAKDLEVSISQVQFSLTAYLIGIAIGQLLYGPLLDRYGRKKPLYIGLLIYVFSSIGCAFSFSLQSLVLLRFMQALGGCVGMVASQALVRDLFPPRKIAQAFSSIILVIAVSPMIAPTVGGYITVALGWQAVFIALATVTFLILAATFFFLPMGKPADAEISLKPFAILSNFALVSKQPQFIIYAIAGGIAMSAPFAYIAASADVFLNLYGASEQQYGWIFAFIASAMIGSAQFNHFLLKKFSSQQLVKFALRYQVVAGAIMVAGIYLHWFNMIGLTLTIFFFMLGQGLTGPNSSALALAPFIKHAGSAASLLGSFRMLVGGIITAIVSALHTGTAMPMVLGMWLTVVVAILLLTSVKVVIRYRARRRQVQDEPAVLL
ncbi:MAG: multidrug effflux MFS transporter [Cytophagales bacterium]|nr:multidrug effflux MFS transporter [Cytophagales bacterium]